MMLIILGFLILIILFLVFALIAEKEKTGKAGNLPKALEVTQEMKKENRQKILNLAGRQNRISNNEAEKLLQVSDATATRYLEELEKDGEIVQHSETGRGVHYEKRLK